jgi:beta-1,4-N-acetylglucosaminyltransferase
LQAVFWVVVAASHSNVTIALSLVIAAGMVTVSQLVLTTLLLILLLSTVAGHRLWTILDPRRPKAKRRSSSSTAETHLMVVLGSGGHTAEMIAMLNRAVHEEDSALRLEWSDFSYRTWVVSSGDGISADRAQQFEDAVVKASSATNASSGTYTISTVPRAREIHQSALTAPVSCLRCLIACLSALYPSPDGAKDFPDVILCNGPATATILIFTSILLHFFDIGGCNTRGKMRTVYVESWARVKRLSLSGRLLSRVVDRFLVQWPQLEAATGGRGEYIGVLV